MSANQPLPDTGNGLMRFRIRPSNNPSSGVFAYEGNPNLSFALPQSNVILDPSSLRVCGRIRYSTPVPVNPENITYDSKIGLVNSCWENISISSLGTRNVIERINQYNRLCQSIVPTLNGADGYLGNLCEQSLGADSYTYQNAEFDAALTNGDGADFACPLLMGLTLTGSKLPLHPLQGLIINLELASNEAVFCVSGVERPKYELYDLSLTGEYLIPTPEQREALMSEKGGVIQCNTFTQLFSILQSTQHSYQANLGMSELISMIFSFAPASSINNYAANQFQALRVVDQNGATQQATKMQFLKNGVATPYTYDLNVLLNSSEAQLQQSFLQSLRKLNDLTKITLNQNNNDPRYNIGCPGYLVNTANQQNPVNKLCVSYGIPYDFLGEGRSGANFKNQPVTINVTTSLTDSNPNACWLFALAKTIIEYDANGIRVIS